MKVMKGMMMMMKRRKDRWNCNAGSNHDETNDNPGIDLLLRGVRGFQQLTEACFQEGHGRVDCNRDGRGINDVMSL